MATFVLICTDKPDSLQLRTDTREAHLAYIRSVVDKVAMAGPMLNEAGESVGSVIFLEVADLAEAQAFAASDPYAQAGLFAEVVVRPFKVVIGKLG